MKISQKDKASDEKASIGLKLIYANQKSKVKRIRKQIVKDKLVLK